MKDKITEKKKSIEKWGWEKRVLGRELETECPAAGDTKGATGTGKRPLARQPMLQHTEIIHLLAEKENITLYLIASLLSKLLEESRSKVAAMY